jgi:small subunit ribosomal protein S2
MGHARRGIALATVTMKELLEAGVHFGHQTRRWNPKMKRYIYAGRNGIYIIDLHQTLKLLEDAYEFVRNLAASGGSLLFVGTKKQAQEAVREAAEGAQQYYVTERWLGGMLTNWRTIKQRIDRLHELRRMEADGILDRRPKKERARLLEEKAKLERVLSGVESMPGLPHAMFIVDTRQEHIAILEAKRLSIPVVAIVDTNCDPDEVDHIIPGNDDAIRAIRLITGRIAEAVSEGRAEFETRAARAALAEQEAAEGMAEQEAAVGAAAGEVEAAMLGSAEEAEEVTEVVQTSHQPEEQAAEEVEAWAGAPAAEEPAAPPPPAPGESEVELT